MIDRIHQAKENVDYILINPAAFTHPRVAIRDAQLTVAIPLSGNHLSPMRGSRSATLCLSLISLLALSANRVQTVIQTLYRQRLNACHNHTKQEYGTHSWIFVRLKN
ncbi:hypothetical protein ACUY4R_002702 [Kosakonia sp. BK9b]